jgi:hypothetical protein
MRPPRGCDVQFSLFDKWRLRIGVILGRTMNIHFSDPFSDHFSDRFRTPFSTPQIDKSDPPRIDKTDPPKTDPPQIDKTDPPDPQSGPPQSDPPFRPPFLRPPDFGICISLRPLRATDNPPFVENLDGEPGFYAPAGIYRLPKGTSPGRYIW